MTETYMGFVMSDALLYVAVGALVVGLVAIFMVLHVAHRLKRPFHGTWHYRVVKTEIGYGLYEVRYLRNGAVGSVSQHPVTFRGGSPKDVEVMLRMALAHVQQYGVIDLPERLRPHHPNRVAHATTETFEAARH